jgi:hypothetical protein
MPLDALEALGVLALLLAMRWAARVPRGRMTATEVRVREATSKSTK